MLKYVEKEILENIGKDPDLLFEYNRSIPVYVLHL